MTIHPEILDGVSVQTEAFEYNGKKQSFYHVDDEIEVILDRNADGSRQLAIRFDGDYAVNSTRNNNQAAFDRLFDAYVAACKRHGVATQPREKMMAFLTQVKGHGNLWSA